MSDVKKPTGRLLLYAFRAFESLLIDRLQHQGIADISMSHFNILRHVDPDGIRQVDLAHDACISKQAVGKMVAELEKKQYLFTRDDPADNRAKQVCYTQRGQQVIQLLVDEVMVIEQRLMQQLGEKEYANLREHLLQFSLLMEDLKNE